LKNAAKTEDFPYFSGYVDWRIRPAGGITCKKHYKFPQNLKSCLSLRRSKMFTAVVVTRIYPWDVDDFEKWCAQVL
jgi:hypothetical protein